MKRTGKKGLGGRVIALALTWDGARWPADKLAPKVRAFLGGKSVVAPVAGKLSHLFADDRVKEIRVCWVPRLKGGDDVLTEPFSTATGKKIAFASTKIAHFGDLLGVVYRRA